MSRRERPTRENYVDFDLCAATQIMNTKILLLVIMTLNLALCAIVNAQSTGKIARIGLLADGNSPQLQALRQGLRDHGYIEGRNLLIEYRYAEGNRDRISQLIT